VTVKKIKDSVANGVVDNKHSAACSLIRQPADLMSSFRDLSRESKTTTASGTKSAADLKSKFLTSVRNLGAAVNMKPSKLNSLGDWVGCFPASAAKSFTARKIRERFVDAGIVGLSDDLPDFKQIMRTCARPISLEEEQLACPQHDH